MDRSEKGVALAIIALKLWQSQGNSPKVYLSGRRIHHGLVGLALTLLARDPLWRAFGATLAIDDIKDAKEWL